MNEDTATPDVKELRGAYANALLAFNAASAALILSFAADVRPERAVVAAEEEARAALVAARESLWATYAG